MASKKRQKNIQAVIEKYIAADCEWPAPLSAVIDWAVGGGLIDQPTTQQLLDDWTSGLQSEFSNAARQMKVNAEAGIRCRRMLANKMDIDEDGKTKQLTFWCPIESATYEYMHRALEQLVDAAKADMRAAKGVQDYYNANHLPDNQQPIQLDFDNVFIDEHEQAGV